MLSTSNVQMYCCMFHSIRIAILLLYCSPTLPHSNSPLSDSQHSVSVILIILRAINLTLLLNEFYRIIVFFLIFPGFLFDPANDIIRIPVDQLYRAVIYPRLKVTGRVLFVFCQNLKELSFTHFKIFVYISGTRYICLLYTSPSPRD